MQNKEKYNSLNPAHLSYLIPVPESSLLPISDKYFSAVNIPDNYVLISGNYNEDKENDMLCYHIGYCLSKLHVGVVSGCGKAGLLVSDSLTENLMKDNLYDPERIIFYSRVKKRTEEECLPAAGTVKFFGKTPYEMREKMISKVKAVITVAGKDGTKEEEGLATINKITVIPVARSGGSSFEIWQKYRQNNYKQSDAFKPLDHATFDQLNHGDIDTAVGAAIILLKAIPGFNQ